MNKLLLCFLCFFSFFSFAQTFESFNFTGEASANGWTVHSGSTGPITAITTPSGSGNSLSYPGLPASVGNRVGMSASVSQDINKPFTTTGNEGYVSFLINVTDLTNMTATGSYLMAFGGTAGTSVTIYFPRLYICLGATPNTFNLGILNTSGGTVTPSYIAQDLIPNTTYFVVAKATQNATGGIDASLWLNPIPGAAEPVAGATNSQGSSSWPANGIQSVALRQATGIGTFEIDEIRAGETWASVTPSSASSCITYNTMSATACSSYTLNAQTYTSSGTYTQTLANANAAGCDSIINLNLTINNATSSTLNITNCGDYTLNGQTYTASGTYTQMTQNSNGCDSTITLNLNIVGSLLYYEDLDSDGYGNPAVSQLGCNPIAGYVTNDLDCDDSNSAINPGAIDIPGNGIDEDCNGFDAPLQLGIYEFAGTTDCSVQDVAATNASSNWVFSDFMATGTTCAAGGGIFNRSGWNQSAVIDLNQYNEFSLSGANCTNLNLSKLALNHRTSSTGGTPTIHLRSSLDNFATDIDTIGTAWNGNVFLADTVNLPAAFANLASVTFRFYVTNQATATSTLRMDNVSIWGNSIISVPTLFYVDADGDGFGDPSMDTLICNAPVGFVANNLDCDDANAAINPNTIWYQDLDNDQVGNDNVTITGCNQPNGYVLADGDCDDTDPNIIAPIMYYVDADQDGFGDDATGTEACVQPPNTVAIGGDCDDMDNTIYPGATEICDGLDNNCDGQVDEGLTFLNYYFDGDGDGFGIGNPTVSCEPIAGYATQNGDCDDSNNMAYPGAPDTEGNGIDENCDGVDGILGLEAQELLAQISPNPTSGMVKLSFNKQISANIIVADLSGKVMLDFAFDGNDYLLDLSSLKAGAYLISIKSDAAQSIQRIVKF